MHFRNAEVRLDPDTVPYGGGDTAVIAAWVRPLAGEPIDAPWLIAMCDILPPAVLPAPPDP